MTAPEEALGSFEAKWTGVHPELALALRFLPEPGKARERSFALIGFELEDAAFRIVEDHVAGAKLHWWAEELVRAQAGKPRHPLTAALVPQAGEPAAAWDAVIAGAVAVREAQPAASVAALLEGYQVLYAPLADVEAALFPGVAAPAAGEAASLSRALRQAADLAGTLQRGHLPLPLDLLARHQLQRGQLSEPSPARAAALRDLLRQLVGRMKAVPLDGLSLARVAVLAADTARARRAARATDPAAALRADSARVTPGTAWKLWRSARRRG
ncbi:hypothetical protein [Dokdonella koreensis]|uniref:Phytoene synthase n=1 Tax=Dokdonella koreensis DS-123 TaxID=1300342 RepID=A0A160DUJ8_9GAMM|nr:hypothetical protein [Dokdonella koreensis]ANB18158.1 Hypothetical protein I596_2145 [Dokdonella koreensis DS-123]